MKQPHQLEKKKKPIKSTALLTIFLGDDNTAKFWENRISDTILLLVIAKMRTKME